MTPLDQVTFTVSQLAAVPLVDVRQTVADRGVAVVRGLFDRDELRGVLARFKEQFDANQDARHDPRDSAAIRTNFQKLQIGANSGLNSLRTLGRFMRVFYNPIFAPDVHGLRSSFVTMARFRNLIYNLPLDYAVHGTEGGFWTCSRLQQYPSGGGFMVPHRDHYAQAATLAEGLGYFQVLLLLTEKGVDFESGGAYVDVGDKRWLYEDGCRTGDLIVYDGQTMHGVADIDPMASLELTRLTGRVVAMASLFRLFDAGGADYETLARTADTVLGNERFRPPSGG
jgi:hypothetical protein